MTATPSTLVDKIWDAHVVSSRPDEPDVLYIDLHLVHEVTSPQAFAGLQRRGIEVRRPDRTFATMDHSVSTTGAIGEPRAEAQLERLEQNCTRAKIPLFGRGHARQGIVHVIGPELGLTTPGSTIVCGDSHTATHGAFGALAFGIGTSEVEQVLATQCMFLRRPKRFEVRFEGELGAGVTAKDLVLALIAEIGVHGGTGHVFEFSGPAIERLDMDARMTLCNMSIEAGARAGLVAPDDVTFEYLRGRPYAPRGAAWDAAVERWRALRSDPGATFDRSATIDASAIEPMVTFGTTPAMGRPITSTIPDPRADANRGLARALDYMGLRAGAPLAGLPIDVAFVGSCTNGRLSDLRAAAAVLKGRKVHPRVRMIVVPGSVAVKQQAETEGLDRVFVEAGAEWRNPGCSMCIAMNGDRLEPGQYAISTSNRNFEGRQGPGGRTFLASPAMAAAAAVTGHLTDVRSL